VGGKGSPEALTQRIEGLKHEIASIKDIVEAERIQQRITKLAAGVAVISVGAPTEVEMTEKKHRIEDALEAVRAAQEEGTLPGGGVALLRVLNEIKIETENEDQQLGVEIIRHSLAAPFRQMAVNAGESADLMQRLVETQENNYGYDFRSGGVVDMYVAGIIDPLKVTRTALQNAASVAGTLITTSHAIIEI